MRRPLLFGSALVMLAVIACNGEKVQTPTSDSNFDDDGAQGMMNDPGSPPKDGGRDALPPPPDASDAATDAPAEDAPAEAAEDAPTTD